MKDAKEQILSHKKIFDKYENILKKMWAKEGVI